MTEKTLTELIWEENISKQKKRLSSSNIGVTLLCKILFLFMYIVSPLVRIKIGLVNSRAMGRFYGNCEYFLRMRKLHAPPKNEFTVLISGTPVNHQILRMIARQMTVIQSDRLWNIMYTIRSTSRNHPAWADLDMTGFRRGMEWSVPGPQLRFSSEEDKRGQDILRKIGIAEGKQFVCMFAKDRLYTDSPDTRLDPHSYWGSRDFRNCDITKYLKAAEWLAEQGLYVVRMGIHKPDQLLPSGIHDRIVDYTGIIRPALDDPEFADAYIQATCKFFLGCTSGIYQLSSIFGVPIAYANMVPFWDFGRTSKDMIILKKCRYHSTGEFIPYRKLISMGLGADYLREETLFQLEQDGIEFVENSKDEILDLTMEMNMRLDGTWHFDSEDENLQAHYRAEICPIKCFDGTEFPGRVGSMFLRNNRTLFGIHS